MKRIARTTALLALLPTMLLCSGCQIATLISKPLMGDEKVKAAFHPTDQSTLVFVDDPRGAVRDIRTLNRIAVQTGYELTKAGVIKQIVEPSALDTLRLNEPNFAQWPIDRIGKQVGAAQVLYVLVDSFQPLGTTGDEVNRPNGKVRIKLVHVQTGVSLFPVRGEHGVNTVLTFDHSVYSGITPGVREELERKLAERMGLDVARVFYDHVPYKTGHGFDQ